MLNLIIPLDDNIILVNRGIRPCLYHREDIKVLISYLLASYLICLYDNEVVDATLSTTSALKTYVLGLPSQVYEDAGSTAATVRIALEFVNNGAAIYGTNSGVIPTGATFYLVGSLNPNVSGTPSGPKQVFASDYYTTANITIKDLKSAYATLPDLTNPQLQFALKVDLAWKQGISMDAEIGD